MTYDPSITFRPDPKPKKRQKKSTAIPPEIVAAVFVRDDFTCQCRQCGRQYPPDDHALHCHHVIKRSQGGKHILEHLATVCFECHDLIEKGDIWREYELIKHVFGGNTTPEVDRKLRRIMDQRGI